VRSVVSDVTKSAPEALAATANTEPIERVVNPARGDHYGSMRMQPLEFIIANGLDFLAGNVIKYVARAALGTDARLRQTDLAKARHYVELMIERERSRD
jgi:hypothetical protein